MNGKSPVGLRAFKRSGREVDHLKELLTEKDKKISRASE